MPCRKWLYRQVKKPVEEIVSPAARIGDSWQALVKQERIGVHTCAYQKGSSKHNAQKGTIAI